MINEFELEKIIINAFKEDFPNGDMTTDIIISKEATMTASLIAKEDGVIAGLDVAKKVFEMLDEEVEFVKKAEDGEVVKKGQLLVQISGKSRALLKAERTALNLLQRLSGIATKTRKLVDRVKEFEVRIVDTRKTTPGFRALEKYAVAAGGGHNHRFSLSDGVMIKDNHIAAAGGIKKAVEIARKNIPHTIKIEVETESLEQVKLALEAGADIIMLDNMSMDMMRQAVELINKRAIVEASGNVNIETVSEIASTGVDVISVGAITHSVKALDISMRII